MKEEIKNATILGKTVRRENGKILKRVQDDMVRVQDDKYGFTLAEVLITLGIIGVVAAMTMPSLIAKYQKKVFATKVKQTYAILSNALTSSIAANGTPNEWNFGQPYTSDNDENKKNAIIYIVNTYFKPYLKVAEDIGFKNRGYHVVLSNGITLSFFIDGGWNSSHTSMVPSNIYIIASNNKNTGAYGDYSRDYSRHDIFYKINKSDKFLSFFLWGDKTRENIINESHYGCNNSKAKYLRYQCGALIQYDGWEIKDDYPW